MKKVIKDRSQNTSFHDGGVWFVALVLCMLFLVLSVSCSFSLGPGDYTPCPAEYDGDYNYWCEGNVVMECYETSVDYNHHWEVHLHEDCADYEGSECLDGACVLSGVDCENDEEFCLDNMVLICIGNAMASIYWDCNKSETTCVETAESDASVGASCE